jgi:hypothetical protein
MNWIYKNIRADLEQLGSASEAKSAQSEAPNPIQYSTSAVACNLPKGRMAGKRYQKVWARFQCLLESGR